MSYEYHNQTEQYCAWAVAQCNFFSESHDLQNCHQFSMSKLMWNKFFPSVTKCSKGVDNIDFDVNTGNIVSNHCAWCKI